MWNHESYTRMYRLYKNNLANVIHFLPLSLYRVIMNVHNFYYMLHIQTWMLSLNKTFY